MASDAELKIILTAVDRFSAQLHAISAKLNSTTRATQQTATGVAGLNTRLVNVTRTARNAIAGFVALAIATQGIRSAIGSTIGLAISFEDSFAGIRKTMDLTEDEFKQLAKANRELAKTLPVSVNEINRLGEIAGQLGVRGIPNILEFEETIAKMAVTTNLTADEAATGMARIAAVTQTPISQIDNLASVVVALGNNFATTEAEIVTFALRIAGSASALGFSADQILGIGAAFTAVGVPAERGGTAVQRVLIAIQQAAQEGGTALGDFAGFVGITTAEFRDLAANDPGQLLIRFVEALAAQGPDAIQVLETLDLDSQRLLASILSVAGGEDTLRRAMELAGIEREKNTAQDIEAAKRFGTTSNLLKRAANNWADLGISIGQLVTPALRLGAQASVAFTDTLSGMSSVLEITDKRLFAIALVTGQVTTAASLLKVKWGDAFRALPGPVQSAAIAVAGFIDLMVNSILSGLDAVVGGINSFIREANRLPFVDLTELNPLGLAGKRSDLAGALRGVLPVTELSRQELARLGERQLAEVLAGRQTLPLPPGEPPPDDDDKGGGGAADRALTLADALQDGIIDLAEALELGLTPMEAAMAELGRAAEENANRLFRLAVEEAKMSQLRKNSAVFVEAQLRSLELERDRARFLLDQRIELEQLNRIVGDQGLTGQLGLFRNALVNLGEGFRRAEESVVGFLQRLTQASVDAVRQRFDDLFSRPTRESAAQELRLAQLRAQRARLLAGGRSEDELAPILEPLDREIEAIQKATDLREAELDVVRAQLDVADQTLLTDRQLITEGHKLVDLFGEQTGLLLDLNAQLALEEIAMSSTTAALERFTDALSESADVLAGRAGTGTAGLLAPQINVTVQANTDEIVAEVSRQTREALRDSAFGGQLRSSGAFAT